MMEEHLQGTISPGARMHFMHVPNCDIQLLDVWEVGGNVLLSSIVAGRRSIFGANRFQTYAPIIVLSGQGIDITVENIAQDSREVHIILGVEPLKDRPTLAVCQPESDLRERFARAANLSPSTATVEQVEARIAALVNDAESIYGSKLEAWKKIANGASDLYEKEIASREDAASENTALRNELSRADRLHGSLCREVSMLCAQLRKAGIKPRLDGF
jgi:hypothetical protein